MDTGKKKQRRIRWVWWCKWGGAAVCVLIALMLVPSRYWMFAITFGRTKIGTAGDMISIADGSIGVGYCGEPGSTLVQKRFELGVRIEAIHPEQRQWSTVVRPWYHDWGNGIRSFTLPLWIPFLLIALPTWRLFILDKRRHRPGQCAKCGYDLTGNTTGKCPECGATTARAASS